MPRAAKTVIRAVLYSGIAVICLAAGAVLYRSLAFRGPARPVSPLPAEPIIDMHVHVAGLGAGESGCFVSDAIRDSYKLDIYLGAFDSSMEEVEREGDRLAFERIAGWIDKSRHVSGAIVLALDGVVRPDGKLDRKATEMYVPNEFVRDNARRFPSLYYGASINPYRTDALQRLQGAAAEGARLVKWIPSIQMIDPADPRIVPFYRRMAELGIPLLTHTGNERSFTRADDSLADPERLALALESGVTVVAAHVATTGENRGEDNMERLLRMFGKYPRLYADISSLTQVNKLGYLDRALKDPRTRGRLVYGSDFPLTNLMIVSPYYFPFNLTFGQMRSLSRISNTWDRDVKLKQALGVPADIFRRSGELFGIGPRR
jgi:predicted TIM-barrel fold metal-dependent hydrolase